MRSTRKNDLPGLRVWCPRWSCNTTEHEPEKARAPGTAFATHTFLLQFLQPLEGVVEITIRAATGGVEPLRAIRFERPKMTGIDPLWGIVQLKAGMVPGLGWKELREKD